MERLRTSVITIRGPGMVKRKGIALIILLAIVSILLTMVIAIFIQSNVELNKIQYQLAVSLAETGSEAARGWVETQTNQNGGFPGVADTGAVASGGNPTVT